MRFAFVGIALLMVTVLALSGRVWWCEAGDMSPWSWDVWSTHNSQHLVDPYALSHIEHGLGVFTVLTVLSGLWRLPKTSVGTRSLIVATFEATWEVVENTPYMINRYREATISLDYFGDSITNSVSDYIMCLLGAFVVRKTSWKVGLAAFCALEIISLVWIRDSLLLNIVMLISPIYSMLMRLHKTVILCSSKEAQIVMAIL